MNCEDCNYIDIADWEHDETTGKANLVYWCERYKELCSNINECQYKAKNEDEDLDNLDSMLEDLWNDYAESEVEE